jgi:hypothetical protein
MRLLPKSWKARSNRCGIAGKRSTPAREKRAPLDLDLPERRVQLDEKGASSPSRRASGSTRTS